MHWDSIQKGQLNKQNTKLKPLHTHKKLNYNAVQWINLGYLVRALWAALCHTVWLCFGQPEFKSCLSDTLSLPHQNKRQKHQKWGIFGVETDMLSWILVIPQLHSTAERQKQRNLRLWQLNDPHKRTGAVGLS